MNSIFKDKEIEFLVLLTITIVLSFFFLKLLTFPEKWRSYKLDKKLVKKLISKSAFEDIHEDEVPLYIGTVGILSKTNTLPQNSLKAIFAFKKAGLVDFEIKQKKSKSIYYNIRLTAEGKKYFIKSISITNRTLLKNGLITKNKKLLKCAIMKITTYELINITDISKRNTYAWAKYSWRKKLLPFGKVWKKWKVQSNINIPDTSIRFYRAFFMYHDKKWNFESSSEW